jgi:hypothetical protein
MTESITIRAKKMIQGIDWILLILLLLVLDVKLVVKLAGLVFIYLARFNFAFGFSWRNSRLPLFYPLILALGIISSVPYLFSGTPHYWLVMLTGIGFWIMSLLVIHQLKLAVETTPVEKVHKTIECFLVLNVIFSCINLCRSSVR